MIYHLILEPTGRAPRVLRFNGRKIGRERALEKLALLVAEPPFTGTASIYCEDTGATVASVPLFCERTLTLADITANMLATAHKLSGRF
jgi:hypothetical protein